MRVDADDEIAGCEFGLRLDLSVDHILQDGIPAVVIDDLQCVLFLFWGLDYVDVPTGAFADLAVPPVDYLVNLYFFVRQHGN